MKNKMNKAGKTSTGVILLIVALVVFAYATDLGGIKSALSPSEQAPIVPAVGRCPSSGLTEVTINAQEALASSATDAEVDYYVYDDNLLVKEGSTTTGTASFDLECGADKSYQMIVLNETVAEGFYPQTVTVDATGPTDTHNFKMYQYGQPDISSIVASEDPSAGKNLSGAAGRTTGFTITFVNNESASAVNKPLILCRVNSSAISDVTMSGVTEANAKKPTREITALPTTSGHQFYTFEYPELVKSTDAAIKVSGKIQFSDSAVFSDSAANNMTCVIVDQATYQVPNYNTLSLSEGFLEAAEDETLTDVGAPDSGSDYVFYGADA